MNVVEQAISFAGETLVLTNQRALFWPRKEALVLSDLHLGKAAHFRKNGIALSTQVSVHDLQRLAQLIAHYTARLVIIAGDLVHAGANKEVELFGTLTEQFSETRFILIRGNHDRFPDDKLKAIGIYAVYQQWNMDTIDFSHKYNEDTGGPTISGHIHPGVSVQLPAGKRLRLPCYVVTENRLILPAFSLFTGLDTSLVSEDAEYYAFYEGGIFKIG